MAIQRLRPKLVIIEFNQTIANSVRFVQEKRVGITQGASALALVQLATAKGYELIAVPDHNLLFVDSKWFALLRIPDNSLGVMRDDSQIPNIFFGYDGKVFLAQAGSSTVFLTWHKGLVLDEYRVQALPRFLRRYPPNYSPAQRTAYRAHLLFLSLRRFIRRLVH